MSPPHRLIAFLRDCYEADNRQSAISNLLDDRVCHLQVPLLGWDFVTGRVDRVPLPREDALAAAREAALHRTEKSLVFAALVVVGRAPDAPRRALCAPLVHFPAVVEDAEPNAFLRVDPTERRLNDRVLAALLPAGRSSLDELAERWPDLPLGPLELDDLASVLADLLPDLDLGPLHSDPRELSLDGLGAEASHSRRLKLLPATAVALVPSSPDTREVLGELGRLAETGPLSPPLVALLGPPGPDSGPTLRPPRPQAPATLSAAQRRVLASAATRPLTVVVGPPGTGKSFTVAHNELDAVHFRRRSLLDLVTERASSQAQVVLLDEHFRSQPRIIAFSNREFYGDRLKVMTQRPDTVRHPSLELRRVPGHRDRRGVNEVEADRLVDEVAGWVEAERGLAAAHSLGILSPFRDQVDHLTALIGQRLDSGAIARHRLLVSTAHGFQGEERDLMFLSLAVDPGSSPGCTRFLTRPDVFNVAVTRARDLQVVFCSLDPAAVPQGLLRRYLDHLVAAHDAPTSAAPPGDPFLDEVAAALEARGCTVWPAFPVAGREVDLVVERSGSSLGIDLVGQRGRFREAFDLERYRLARRAGLRLLPLPLSAWSQDREACLVEFERWLERARNPGGRMPAAP